MNQDASKAARGGERAGWFTMAAARVGALATVLLASLSAWAQPIELKFASVVSESSGHFTGGIKPFVDAVNAEGKGLLAIKVYPDGALGKATAEQPGLVLSGKADFAMVSPGQTPYRFPDNDLLEIPGLFHDVREGTLAYTRLLAAGALRGYEDYFVIGAYITAPASISSRKALGSLAELRGQKIRTANAMEAEVVAHFGAIPTVMPATQLANALTRGAVDGAVITPGGLSQFGAASLATHHYLIGLGPVPILVLMNRKKFGGLPSAAQALIRKYSGEWAAKAWIASFGATEQHALDLFKSDSAHTVVEPSSADRAAMQQIYASLAEAWAARSPHNRALLERIQADLKVIRSTAH